MCVDDRLAQLNDDVSYQSELRSDVKTSKHRVQEIERTCQQRIVSICQTPGNTYQQLDIESMKQNLR